MKKSKIIKRSTLLFLLTLLVLSGKEKITSNASDIKNLIPIELDNGSKIGISGDFLKSDYKYTIKKGDNLKKISKKTHLSKEKLLEIDKSLNTKKGCHNAVGKTITQYVENTDDYIYYQALEDTSLEEVAKTLNTTVNELMKENNLVSTKITKNQIIRQELTLKQRKAIIEDLKDENGKFNFSNPVTIEKNIEDLKDQELNFASSFGNYTGIDISYHNGDINFKKVKDAGIDFVIIRLFDACFFNYQTNELNQIDQKLETYTKDCEKEDIPYGLYLYSRATTEEMARQEARKALDLIKRLDLKPSWPIYYDIEAQDSQPLYTKNKEAVSSTAFIANNSEQVVNNFKAFADEIKKAGYYAGIYSGDNILQQLDKNGTLLSDYPVWGARYKYYDKDCDFENFDFIFPGYKGDLGVFQFSSSGSIDGINGRVDCNVSKYNYNTNLKDPNKTTEKEIVKYLQK